MRKVFLLFNILPFNYKVSFFILIVLCSFASGLETLSIGLILPFINSILKPESELSGAFSFLFPHNLNSQELIFLSLSFIFISYIFKSIFIAFVIWFQFKLIFQIKTFFANKLYSTYLNADYVNFTRVNPSFLLSNITTETNQLAFTYLTPLLLLFSEVTVLFSISLFLFFYNPIASSLIFIIFTFSIFIFYSFSKKYLFIWGQGRQDSESFRCKLANESFTGIKDIKLYNFEKYFIESFSNLTSKVGFFESKQMALSNFPRLYLEFIGISSIAISLFFLVHDDNIQDVLPLIAIFAAASFRVIPSANRIITSLQSIRYGLPILNLLYKEIILNKNNSTNSEQNNVLIFNKSIFFDRVFFKYPSSKDFILKNINFSIFKNDSIGIFGDSGSGKSTLTDLILGLIKPTSGNILIDGVHTNLNLTSWCRNIAYVHQQIFILNDTIKKNIIFGSEYFDNDRMNLVLKQSQLSNFVDELPNGIDTLIGPTGIELSGGLKQRLCIARALYKHCEILIFDESTNALDNQTEFEIFETIRSLKGKHTLVIISHKHDLLNFCDKKFEISNGNLITHF